jgi:multidrug transporter EmrE-like cation transporter
MNLSTFAFLMTGVVLNAFGQLLLKAGTNALGGAIHITAENWFATGIKIFTQLPILGGLACYGLSVIVWIIGLSRTDVTLAYPMLSLGYVISTLGAWMFLGEVIPVQRLVAIAVIMLGVALLART